MSREDEDLSPARFRALAILLPMGLLALHRDLGHHGDIEFFHDWYLAFREGPAFYRDGPGLNYPIVGVLLACGPAWLVERLGAGRLDLDTFRYLLKATIALGEIGFVFAARALAGAVGRARPRRFALLLYALPATWAGGAWFGQLDVWGSALLLIAAWAFVTFPHRERPLRTLLAGLLALHGAILLKQLTFFSIPGLLLLSIASLRALASRRPGGPTRPAVILAALSPLIWLLADPLLVLPEGYRSHLWWVLAGGGSDHADLIVGGGASLWSLLLGPSPGSAHAVGFAGLSLFAWSIVLFALAQLPALSWLSKRRDDPRAFLLYVGYANLSMATLLTGVHERYLVHGVPFLLLGIEALRPARWARAGIWVITGWWGLFVLASIHFDALVLRPFRRHEPVALLLVALLGVLAVTLGRQSIAPPRREIRSAQ